jgi:hypothetical protein
MPVSCKPISQLLALQTYSTAGRPAASGLASTIGVGKAIVGVVNLP